MTLFIIKKCDLLNAFYTKNNFYKIIRKIITIMRCNKFMNRNPRFEIYTAGGDERGGRGDDKEEAG